MATYPSLGDDIIRLPDDMVSSSTVPKELISKMFGSDPTMLRNVDFMSSRAILGACNVDVNTIDDLATDNLAGVETPPQRWRGASLEQLPLKLPLCCSMTSYMLHFLQLGVPVTSVFV